MRYNGKRHGWNPHSYLFFKNTAALLRPEMEEKYSHPWEADVGSFVGVHFPHGGFTDQCPPFWNLTSEPDNSGFESSKNLLSSLFLNSPDMYPQTDIFSQLAKGLSKGRGLEPMAWVAKQGWLVLGSDLRWRAVGPRLSSRKQEAAAGVKRRWLLIFKSLCVCVCVCVCEEVCTLPACWWMCELEAHAAAAAGPPVEGWGVFTCSCRSYAECNSFQLGFPLPQLSSARCFLSLWCIQSLFCTWVKWLVNMVIIFFSSMRWKVRLLHVCTNLRQSSYLLCLSWFQKTHTFTSTSGIKERFPSCYSISETLK